MHDTRDLTARRRRGFLLFPVLVIIGGLVLLGAEGLVRSTIELRAANRFLAKQQALALAEGRLDEVVAAMSADPIAAGQWTACPAPAAAPLGTTTCTLMALGGGTPFVEGPGGVIKQRVQIQVSGLVPDALNPQGRQTVTTIVDVPVGNVFQAAARGPSLSLNHMQVDSYDSSIDRNPSVFGSNATIQSEGWAYVGTEYEPALRLRYSQVFGDLFIAASPITFLTGTSWLDPAGGLFPDTTSARVAFWDYEGESGQPSTISGVVETRTLPARPRVRVPQGTPAGSSLTSCPGGALSLNVASFPYATIDLRRTTCNITLNGNGTLFLNYLYLIGSNQRLTVNGNVQVVTYQPSDTSFGGPGLRIEDSTVVLGANASFTAYNRSDAGNASILEADINNPASGSLGRPKDFTVYWSPSRFAPNTNTLGGTYHGTYYEDVPPATNHSYLQLSGGYFDEAGNYVPLPTKIFGSINLNNSIVLGGGWGVPARLHQDVSLMNERGAGGSPANPIRRRSWRVQ